jgi:hypothetical protein
VCHTSADVVHAVTCRRASRVSDERRYPSTDLIRFDAMGTQLARLREKERGVHYESSHSA